MDYLMITILIISILNSIFIVYLLIIINIMARDIMDNSQSILSLLEFIRVFVKDYNNYSSEVSSWSEDYDGKLHYLKKDK
jgi:hypothetical protein